MEAIPEGLPLPVREGYRIAPVSRIVRTTMASGRAMQRRKYRSVPAIVTVSWLFTDTEAKIFDGWCEYDIKWAAWFLCPIKTPVGFTPTRARFTDEPVIPEPEGQDLWRYTAVLEVYELPIVDEATYTGLLAGMDLPVMNAALRKLLQRWYTKTWPGAPAS